MGWSGVHFDEKIRTAKEKKMAMDYEVNDGLNEVIKSSMVGNVYYAAVKKLKTGEVYGLVGLVRVKNTDFINFRYKLISDIEGPVEAKCPRSILALLSPTDNELANNWRNRCKGEV